MDLNRQHLVGKVRSAERRLESLEAATIEEQRLYMKGAEAEVERAQQRLTDYDKGVPASKNS